MSTVFAAWLAGCTVVVASLGAMFRQPLATGPDPVVHEVWGARRHQRPHCSRRPRHVAGEIRRHDGTGDTHRAAPAGHLLHAQPNRHALLSDDERARRWRVANLIEETGEITSDDLSALLGPRPASLIGASA